MRCVGLLPARLSFFLFNKFEHNDDTYFSIIKNCFDKEGNNEYGLFQVL